MLLLVIKIKAHQQFSRNGKDGKGIKWVWKTEKKIEGKIVSTPNTAEQYLIVEYLSCLVVVVVFLLKKKKGFKPIPCFF